MKSPLLAITSACLAFAMALVHGSQAADTLAAKPVRPEGPAWLTPLETSADFDFLRAVLEEAHAGLYRYSTKSVMDRQFDKQRAKLDHSMRMEEFMAVVAETLAAIHCGHTSCEPDPDTQKSWATAPLFPLRVFVEENRLVTLLNDTADDKTFRPGMEILEINGHTASDILARIWRTESADGDIQTAKRVHVGGRFGQFYHCLVEQTDSFTVTGRDSEGLD